MTDTADAAWAALNSALVGITPPCKGQALFTADRLTAAQRAQLEAVCTTCHVVDLCDTYATAAEEPAGFWAGHWYTPKGRK